MFLGGKGKVLEVGDVGGSGVKELGALGDKGGINKSYHRNIAFTHCKITHDLAMELGKYSTKLVAHSCVSWKHKFNLEVLEE